jgi:hypothetical protein
VDHIDNPPDWMMNGIRHDDVEPDEVEPDENALSSILFKAFNEINELGGRERHTLAHTLGRENYDRLMKRPGVAKAADTFLSASPTTKKAAAKVLAVRIAQAADEPKLVDRIQRELWDAFQDDIDTAKSRGSPVKPPTPSQIRNHARAIETRDGQKELRVDLHTLAKGDDSRKYIEARKRQEKR